MRERESDSQAEIWSPPCWLGLLVTRHNVVFGSNCGTYQHTHGGRQEGKTTRRGKQRRESGHANASEPTKFSQVSEPDLRAPASSSTLNP